MRPFPGVIAGVTAAGVLLSAVVHLRLWLTGFAQLPLVGPAFLINAIAGLLITVGLLIRPNLVIGLLAAAFGAATLLAFYISVTVGLFGVQETVGGTSQVLGQVSEYVALIGGIAVGAGARRRV
jgi:hypothetical protein